MIELASIQPAKPGSGDRAYSGLHGVWYTDRNAEDGTKPLEVFFAVTYRLIIDDSGQVVDPVIVTTYIESAMQRWIDWHKEGIIKLDPLSMRPDPMDQRPPTEQRQYKTPPPSNDQNSGNNNTPGVFVNHGYKIKRMVDEGKVSYVIAFKMANGKESNYPATISNEKYLKMLAKALADAGHKSAEWTSGEPHMINIDFGVAKSEKTAPNGKAFNDYQWFRVVDTEQSKEPF